MTDMAEQDLDVEGLWTRYGGLVLRRCRQLLRDEEEALDVTQDVFVQLLRRRSRLEVRYPSSLLWKMATNLCLNRLRDRRGAPEATEDETLVRLARLEDPSPAAEARFTLGRLFARHKDSTRLIATLHYVDGLTLEQTAREVGLSVSGVRKRLRGLRETLLQMEAS
jgi:RNA polymerase sigma-70 factor (ECF subfamily)